MAALARGTSRIHGLAPGQDVRSTLICLETLGARISFAEGVEIDGLGLRGLRTPAADLDAGNSCTTMRLMAGVLAAHTFRATLTGDASLSSRPMERVAAPLRAMGARVVTVDGHAPLTIDGGSLEPIAYASPVASAQIKSAVLLAGLQTHGTTSVAEPAPTRDHTERALRAFGVRVDARPGFAAVEGMQPLDARGARPRWSCRRP